MGTYPSPPAPRIPYDLDGTTRVTGAAVLSAQNAYNATDNSSGTFTIVFPYPYDIYAYEGSRSSAGGGNSARWEYSQDTTNGVDGTWTDLAFVASSVRNIAARRSNLVVPPSPITGVTGILLYDDAAYVASSVLYGVPSSTPDGLQIWDATDNHVGAVLDFGNVPVGTTAIKSFRIKNCSASDDASGITMTGSTPDASSPATEPFYTISVDGGATFQSLPADLDDLPAGTISPVYQLKYSPSTSAALAPVAARWTVAVGTWS